MRWTPYVQFRTGIRQLEWEALSAEEQRRLYYSKTRKEDVESSPKPALHRVITDGATVRYPALPIVLMDAATLAQLPMFSRF
jgi:hypothetical protein